MLPLTRWNETPHSCWLPQQLAKMSEDKIKLGTHSTMMERDGNCSRFYSTACPFESEVEPKPTSRVQSIWELAIKGSGYPGLVWETQIVGCSVDWLSRFWITFTLSDSWVSWMLCWRYFDDISSPRVMDSFNMWWLFFRVSLAKLLKGVLNTHWTSGCLL